jgi:hypothetical protein
MKIVINKDTWFCISKEAALFMAERGNEQAAQDLKYNSDDCNSFDGEISADILEYNRTDPDLVAAIEVLQHRANGFGADLKIIEIPDGTDWGIYCDDRGSEFIYDKNRVWGME